MPPLSFQVQSREVVIDPFCGRGTVLALANELGLTALGVDVDAACVKAAERLDMEKLRKAEPGTWKIILNAFDILLVEVEKHDSYMIHFCSYYLFEICFCMFLYYVKSGCCKDLIECLKLKTKSKINWLCKR